MLTDLDDFIGPSQACTNPLFAESGAVVAPDADSAGSV